eukprot:TRINITY_DN8101_c0_g1_i3.p1 TRINITY_DN8101_c0_g1~~TRINITY_DN8101_c0_g1_i3.p1  ORF type:complete len:115 (+),score=39.85 TRINITY_DN8101_c0_g1_i3:117-461(+)
MRKNTEKNFVPGTDQYKKDMCTGCRVAFKFINKEVAKYPEGATGEMRAAIILDSQPCKWAVGPTQSKCYRVIEELEAEIEEYIIEGKVDKAETDSLCFKYCEGIPEEEGEQQEL